MRAVQLFEAFDGQRFETSEACKAHEAEHVESRLVGLTIAQVRAALDRSDPDLADVLELIGGRIGKARRESGEVRRKVATKPEAAAPAPAERPAPADETEAETEKV